MRRLMYAASLLGLAMGGMGSGPIFSDIGPTFIPDESGSKGHRWAGKRRKLKKYMQDHQRPNRRRK